jgi:hypothetical protein
VSDGFTLYHSPSDPLAAAGLNRDFLNAYMGGPRRMGALLDWGSEAYPRWTCSPRVTEWPAAGRVDDEASMNDRCPPPEADTRETTCRTAFIGAADMVRKTVGKGCRCEWVVGMSRRRFGREDASG